MSGISHLYDIYNKKGKDFVENLFNSYVTVNEKMDGSAFMFERDVETGKFIFYKRDQRNPITMVDRTLMKYYEKPILYIESLPIHIIKEIPRGWKFGLEYFSNPNPVEIAYDRIPKNNLILSYVKPKEDSDSEQITDKKKLDVTWDDVSESVPTFTFKEFLYENNITHIDFLKCDCEGGEYDVFQQSNIEFLKTIPKIVTEFHMRDDDSFHKCKFRWFRDNIFPQFDNIQVFSVDGIDIKWDLWNEHFIEYYSEVIVYMDNRK